MDEEVTSRRRRAGTRRVEDADLGDRPRACGGDRADAANLAVRLRARDLGERAAGARLSGRSGGEETGVRDGGSTCACPPLEEAQGILR